MSCSDLPTMLSTLDARFASRRVALADGVQVGVRSCGRRGRLAPVFLAHGISSGAASWLQVALHLSTLTEVVAWDAPGYGESTPLATPQPDERDYGDRMHQLLSALDLQHAVLVGHSLGALMSMACAHSHGAAAVLLISPALGYGRAAQAASRTRVQAERSAALHNLGIAGLAERIDQRLLSHAGANERAWVRWNAAQMHAAGYLQAVHMLSHGDLDRSVAAGAAVRVCCGELDIVTPPAQCRDWAQAHGLPFAAIPAAGHASPIEQPEAVARLIAAALHEHAGSSQGSLQP